MTMITGDQIPRFAIVVLKGHLKMMALGMNNSRISRTEMLRKATEITGKKYKRGQHAIAAQDLQEYLDANV